MLPKTGICLDCSAPILKTSKRCRKCQMALAVKSSPASKPIGEQRMTDAEKTSRWRKRHPEKDRQVRLDARQSARQKVADYKEARGCEKCGISDPRVLDLHHKDGEDKIMAVSQMMYRFSWEKVVEEMDKCRVLCANCHRIEHARDDHLIPATMQINAAGFFRAS